MFCSPYKRSSSGQGSVSICSILPVFINVIFDGFDLIKDINFLSKTQIKKIPPPPNFQKFVWGAFFEKLKKVLLPATTDFSSNLLPYPLATKLSSNLTAVEEFPWYGCLPTEYSWPEDEFYPKIFIFTIVLIPQIDLYLCKIFWTQVEPNPG